MKNINLINLWSLQLKKAAKCNERDSHAAYIKVICQIQEYLYFTELMERHFLLQAIELYLKAVDEICLIYKSCNEIVKEIEWYKRSVDLILNVIDLQELNIKQNDQLIYHLYERNGLYIDKLKSIKPAISKELLATLSYSIPFVVL